MNTLYTVTVPLFVNMLGGLKNILTKAEHHAKEHGMDEAAFLNDRLAPDMFPLVKQVQIACDHAKGAVARLTGKENPVMEDNEQTFAELFARIDKTLSFVQSVNEGDFADAADRHITIPYFPGKYLTGSDYALSYVVPNFLFHVVTAYGLVRKNGVNIGKADFTNNIPFKDLES